MSKYTFNENIGIDGTNEIDEPIMEEVKEITKRSKNKKTPGNDNPNAELIKYGA